MLTNAGKMYAIQEISTGRLLPVPRGSRSRRVRGGTRVEFGDTGHPRIFSNLQHATNALRWWLQGAVSVTTYYDQWDSEYTEDWNVTLKSNRKPDDVRIVEVTLAVTPC